MTWDNQSGTESQVGALHELGQTASEKPQFEIHSSSVQGSGAAAQPHKLPDKHLLSIGLRSHSDETTGKAFHVFTLSLGQETVELLPFRNWGQLDAYKWTARGKLPGIPAGLEIAADHVKIAGETVTLGDPEACPKLEKAFNEWLSLENKNLELSRKKLHAKPQQVFNPTPVRSDEGGVRFKVEVDKRHQVRITCLQDGNLVAVVGLTVQGFGGLFNQGLMRKPRLLDVGAMHDWVELDGELCSFEHGNDESSKLEKLLNDRYAPLHSGGLGRDIVIFENAASPTGFDIQFPVTVGGLAENRRRTLNDAALELLQEPTRCGLLQPDLIIKLSPPSFIFKRKTADGGEAYLESNAENMLSIAADDGKNRKIDLSHPVIYSHLSVVDLTAVFNHPSINRHGKAASSATGDAPNSARPVSQIAPAKPPEPAVVPQQTEHAAPQKLSAAPLPVPPPVDTAEQAPDFLTPAIAKAEPQPAPAPIHRTNLWMKDILAQEPIRFDWFASLIYGQIAQHWGNSNEGSFGPSKCWAVAQGECTDPSDPAFIGVFITQKGGLGFLSGSHMARFHRGVVFLGGREAVVEGIDIQLIAVGINELDQLVFIVSDGFASKFGVPEHIIRQDLVELSQTGALLLSVDQVLHSPIPVHVLWTVPAIQSNPAEPQALESFPPEPLDSLSKKAA